MQQDTHVRQVSLITGLAPGADLVIKRVAADWLRDKDIEVQTIALLQGPLEMLIGAGLAKSHE